MANNNIIIKGARVNNLKNIDLEIPRGKFIVITGLSGSGKSSLAFDTLYAEGQRRYVESMSSYARQFLGRMQKPECDFIKGLPPAIAIEQKVSTRNPRSTVGTASEIYDYLRLLYARIGKTYSPVSGNMVKKNTVDDVVRCMSGYAEGTRIAIVTPIVLPSGRTLAQQLDIYKKEGFSRLECDGQFLQIDEADTASDKQYALLIDRLTASADAETVSRLTDSVETAFYEGDGQCRLLAWTGSGIETTAFSKRFEEDGIDFIEPTDQLFNFNNPYGACPTCEGFGRVLGIDENLVIPNKALSVYDDAVVCWRGEKMSEWKREFMFAATKRGFHIHRPYYQLTDDEKSLLWHGAAGIYGIDSFFAMVKENQYKIQYRVMMARYRGKTICPDCGGSRLRREALYVKVGGLTIADVVKMPVADLRRWFDELQLDATDAQIARRLLTEIRTRIGYLCDVGLDYLTLDRLSSSLSGGESQRINLATSLGSSLVGSLYILDEPSIGLHSRDTERLIRVLKRLQQLGNTVVVVEHDEEIMRAADWIIDIGPLAGRGGGKVVYQGPVDALHSATDSLTAKYLTGEMQIALPKLRRRSHNYIEILGAAQNNIKGIDVRFPLQVMTVVTGVSGSGKSTLVRDILYNALLRHFGEACENTGSYTDLRGDLSLINSVEFVDQNPIGKSSRSNAATYLKAFDEVRRLFAEQQGAKQMGFDAGYFSYNAEGGRCEECKGEGTITIEMQFMADITLTCECCHGKRYKPEVLAIEYRGKNIYDVLDMTVNQAIEFFSEAKGTTEARIVKRLLPLQQVGLGYIKLGQSSSTLSGGENQRIKLAYFLSQEKQRPSMFIFDEPTTGLHFHDINTLMASFNRLIEKGHTIVIIEHNLDIVKCADHVIDMGPEGGNGGGRIVATGTPEEIAACEESYTGKFLKEKLLCR